MAQSFEQKSKQQAQLTETRVQSAFEKHEKRLLAVLQRSVNTIESDINDHEARLTRRLGWMLIRKEALTYFLVGVIITASIMGSVWYAMSGAKVVRVFEMSGSSWIECKEAQRRDQTILCRVD
jgi:hypothetical protein